MAYVSGVADRPARNFPMARAENAVLRDEIVELRRKRAWGHGPPRAKRKPDGRFAKL